MSKHNTRILLTGSSGQVGRDLHRLLKPLGEIIAPSRQEFDLGRPESLRVSIREWKPDLIVNPAAYTAVDRAELETDRAFIINAQAPRIMAEEAARLDIPMVHYSTDYVFDGNKSGSYTENNSTNPLNIYGESKLKGEKAILSTLEQSIILRTSWVYSPIGRNFLTTMLKLFSTRDEIRVIADQIGTPNSARMLAEATVFMLNDVRSENQFSFAPTSTGIYHLSSSSQTSWYGFALKIKELFADKGHDPRILPVSSASYGATTLRPLNSCLNSGHFAATWGYDAPHWVSSLKQACTTA